MQINRVIIVVLDSVGIGELPDADRYADTGSNTLANLAKAVGGLRLPNLAALGLGNIVAVDGIAPTARPAAAYGRMAERSAGKDTTTGHWELSGIVVTKPFPTYPAGFPEEVIAEFTKAVERGILGNVAASGTEIIARLGEEHVRTGKPIVYTSADSVFQIAAHEDVIPLEELYEMCRQARRILTSDHAVARVIARPFTTVAGEFKRTANRRDFSLPPTAPTILDHIVASGRSVKAVGKINDIFAGRGITDWAPTHNNAEAIDNTLQFMKSAAQPGLIFANLVDFDMLWGHRNDVAGYAAGLQELDARLPELTEACGPADLLVITADHGCDPTTPGTDHTREYVPLLAYNPLITNAPNLGTRSTFADVAATVAEVFALQNPGPGR